VAETFFEEMRRYVGFGPDDETCLRRLAPHAAPQFARIAEEFYDHLARHTEARRVFADDAQVQRLERTLQVWLRELLEGPWDEAYFARRARIGRRHVEIALPQRYMFGAMHLIRASLIELADAAFTGAERAAVALAVHRIIDLELAIMLETYSEAFLDRVQHLERVEKDLLRRQLALSEARYQEIVEKGEALIVTWEPGRPILLFNRRSEELTGVTRQQAAETTWFDLFGDGRDDPVRSRERALLGGQRQPPFETALRDPSGREHRVRWHLTTLVEPDRTIVCAIGIDVTEEHALTVRTRRAERLASLGTMAAGLAHEIRNPLNAAHLQLTLVDRRLARATPDVGGAREAVSLAAGEIKRLASLVGEFLDFARPQPLRRSRADLRQTAEVIVALLAPLASDVGVDLVLEPGEPVIAEFDDEKMKQVLHNLVRNAVEAAGAGGAVRVRVLHRSREAVLEVEDDGPGFPPDAALFEPFFTTKESGTGLGLAIVHRIVTDHAGAVDVARRGGNTVLSVGLPLEPH
jgi:PAS domain S-box-containing protein